MTIELDFDGLHIDQSTGLLCAVSGGADSMCLLHRLHAGGYKVTAAHFEHGIRGEESRRDMDFVREYCHSAGIPFVCARGEVPAYAREHGLSVEEAARKLRYDFLEEKRRELALDYILTAHNAGDNAETLVFNLIRGSGTRGLKGIDKRRGPILRPMLGLSRQEIERYLEQNSVPHIEDSSNQSDDYSRNFIRHNIIPLMEQINPRFVQAASRTAELCRRDEEALNEMADCFFKESCAADGSIDCAALTKAPAALASRALRKRLCGLSMEHIDAILDFCRGSGSARLDLPGRSIYRAAGQLYFEKPEYRPIAEQRLSAGDKLCLDACGMEISCEIVEYNGEVNDLFKTSYLKYEIIGNDILISSRAAGDSMRPAGRGCSKSLKALFLEKDIPVFMRDSIPVIRDEGRNILMVHGIAIDSRAMPKPGDKALKVNFRNIITGEQE